jgi:hypothetical protein
MLAVLCREYVTGIFLDNCVLKLLEVSRLPKIIFSRNFALKQILIKWT